MLACTFVRAVEVGLAALLVILLCHPDLTLPPDLFDAVYLTAFGLALGTYLLTFALDDKEQDTALPVLLRASTWARVASLAVGVRFLLIGPVLDPWLGASVRHPEHPLGPDLYQGLVPDFFRLVLGSDPVQAAVLFLALGLCLLAAAAHVTRRWTLRAALFLLDGIPNRESALAERLQSLSELEDGRRAIRRENSLHQEMVLAGGSLVKELMVLGVFVWAGLVSQALLQPYAPSYPDHRMLFSYGLLILISAFFSWATAARVLTRRDPAKDPLAPAALGFALSSGCVLLVTGVVTGLNTLLFGASALLLGSLALCRPRVGELPAGIQLEGIPKTRGRAKPWTLTIPELAWRATLVCTALWLMTPPGWLVGLVLLWAAFQPRLDIPGFVRTAVDTLGDARRRWRSYAPKKVERRAEPAPPSPASYLKVDVLRVEVGRQILSIVDPNQGGLLQKEIECSRRQLAEFYGVLLPPIVLKDNLGLKPAGYRILIRGRQVACGEAPVKDPVKQVAGALNAALGANLHKLICIPQLELMLATGASPRLVENLLPRLPLSTLAAVLSRLIEENVPKLGLDRILEVLDRHVDSTTDPGELVERVREEAAEELCALLTETREGRERCLPAAQVPEKIAHGLANPDDPEARGRLRFWYLKQLGKPRYAHQRMVLVTTASARRRVYEVVQDFRSKPVVLSQAQIPPHVKVVPI